MDLLKQTLAAVKGRDETARRQAQERLDQLIMPHWALGRLMDLALDVAGCCATPTPSVARKKIVVMAADHGITATGISLFPQQVTVEMVRGFVAGHAGINVLARRAGAEVKIVDMGIAGDLDGQAAEVVIDRKIARGTADFSRQPAMSREQAIQALEAGIAVAHDLAEETDLFGTGDMGIGNTSPSSAIIAVLCRIPVREATGRGTGLNDHQLEHKITVLSRSLDLHRPDPGDALDVLGKVGGFEIAGIAGLILGAAAQRKPVIIDGVISTAAALIAACLAPRCKDYLIASHRSVERGQAIALRQLGKEPLLDLNFRLGEGTGAAAAMPLVDSAVGLLTEMATFAEAAVSTAGPGGGE